MESLFETVKVSYFNRLADIAAESRQNDEAKNEARLSILAHLQRLHDDSGDSYIRECYTIAALRGIAVNGGSEFAPFVRRIAHDNTFLTRDVAIRALAKVGDSSDIPLLLQYAGESYKHEARIAAEAALYLTDDVLATAQQLVDSNSDENVKLALSRLSTSAPEKATEICLQLLSNKRDAIRKIAIVYLVFLLEDDELERTLEAQLLEGSYYNARCWLDRVLYAPEPIRSAFREELMSEVTIPASRP